MASIARRTFRACSTPRTVERSIGGVRCGGGWGGTPAPPSGGGFSALLLELHDLAATVVAAVRAGVMGAPHLVAVRALDKAGRGEREVRATVALPGVRDLALRETHRGGRSSGVGRRAIARTAWGVGFGARRRSRATGRRRSVAGFRPPRLDGSRATLPGPCAAGVSFPSRPSGMHATRSARTERPPTRHVTGPWRARCGGGPSSSAW